MADQRNIVIIVDDDQAVCEALQFALRLEGLCVHAHGGAASLLADPDLSRAACVVVAHRMPRLDGFALLDSVRANNPGLPAIMLANHATRQVHACAAAAGVRKLLEKPLMDNTLMENIQAILTANG